LTLVEERERRRLAIQLHENIGQILAFARIKLGALCAEAATPDLASDLNEIKNQIDHSIQFTRSLTFELSPPALYELGLADAVHWLASRFQESCETEIEVQPEKLPIPLADDGRIFLFLAVRELLFNAAKHAQARHVKVVITKAEDQLRIQVEDDGVGFDVTKRRAVGFGLFGIKERLDHIRGHLHIKSKPGHGTIVTLAVPLLPDNSSPD
jgi:signal transduction histidine kinase